jgi:surface antigen
MSSSSPEGPLQGGPNSQEMTARWASKMLRVVTAASLGLSGIAVEQTGAYAATGNYPDADATDCSSEYGQYSWCKPNDDEISPRGYAYRNCTDWVAWRIPDLIGKTIPWGLGNAKNWDTAISSNIATVDNTPEAGDVAVWDSGAYGHVEVVESVNTNGTVNTSGYNKKGTGNYGTQSGVTADHYIDLNGTGTGIPGGGEDEPAINPIIDSLVTTDGVRHIYSGTSTGKLYETWWDANHAPSTHLVANIGADIEGISAHQTADGNQHVYYGTQGGTIGEMWWGPNSGGYRVGQTYQLGSAITALSGEVTTDGTQHIYTAAANGKLYESWWNGNPIQTAQAYNLGKTITGLSSEIIGDQTSLFYGATDGTVGEIWYSPTSGGAHAGMSSNVGTNVTALSSEVTPDNVRHIYSADASGQIEETWWGPNSGQPTRHTLADVGQHPSAISDQYTSDGTQHVYYGTSFGQSGEIWWNGNAPSPHETNVSSDPSAVKITSASSAITSDNTQNLFTANQAGNLIARWWNANGSGTTQVGTVS